MTNSFFLAISNIIYKPPLYAKKENPLFLVNKKKTNECRVETNTKVETKVEREDKKARKYGNDETKRRQDAKTRITYKHGHRDKDK